jgi:cystathionine beta-lyase/cystathionine gamma-synthase
MHGFGGMLTIELGSQEAARQFLERVRVFSLAESLGGVESLTNHPFTMTHGSVPADVKLAMGLTQGMVRLSCGIEDEADLLADLEQALQGL